MYNELKRSTTHDCALYEYRNPIGAVKTEEIVTLRLKIRQPNIDKVYVMLLGENSQDKLEMLLANGYYSAQLTTPKTPGVLWYHFCIAISDKVFYYGSKHDKSNSVGEVYLDNPPSFQLTVYDKNFDTPEWFKKSIMYQIFPDRFFCHDKASALRGIEYHKSMGRSLVFHDDWSEKPIYTPLEGESFYRPCDFYGGTLKGIEQKLPYLKKLGINLIYLNPIFEADSNHRYNTSDYFKIDPILGTNEDFERLCKKGKKLGMKIILDGVFSHTGSDSVYFNKNGNYKTSGAYQSMDSPYYNWFEFYEFPDKYRSWWGFDTLPEVEETNPDWQEFIIKGENNLLKYWIDKGCAGYRLDVADELPDETICDIRKSVKKADSEAIVLGEVWEDATVKQSYGVNRKYALGNGLDSVMNYPLRNFIIDFVLGRTDSYKFCADVGRQRLVYPLPMYYSLMNLLSGHDIERIRTALATKLNPHELTREQQGTFHISLKQIIKAMRLQRLCVALQFSLPGVPCVYYGDENGMQGFLDPFNREPFHMDSCDLVDFYEKVAHIRAGAEAMMTGNMVLFAPNSEVVAILRFNQENSDAFDNPAQDGYFLCVVNRSNETQRVVIDLFKKNRLIADSQRRIILGQGFKRAVCKLTGKIFPIESGQMDLNLESEHAYIFELE